jgi:hypothetical protein
VVAQEYIPGAKEIAVQHLAGHTFEPKLFLNFVEIYNHKKSQTPYLFLYLQATTAWTSFVVAAMRVDRSLPSWEQ